jgi:hypothetical protein
LAEPARPFNRGHSIAGRALAGAGKINESRFQKVGPGKASGGIGAWSFTGHGRPAGRRGTHRDRTMDETQPRDRGAAQKSVDPLA